MLLDPTKNFRFSSFLCNDIEQFRDLASQLEWELETTQLSCGSNRIQFDHAAFPEVSVSYHHVKQAMYDVFEIPPGHVVFAICRSKLPVVSCGIEIPASVMQILRPLRSHWVKLPAGWETYEFTVSEQLLERTELFPPNFFKKTIRLEQSFLPLSEPQTRNFLKGMDYFFQIARNLHGGIEDLIPKTEFYNFIFDGLQQIIDVGLAANHDQQTRSCRRQDLVEKAKDLMSSNLKLDLTAEDIAKTLGVSYRVLNYALKDTLGISPYQFFLTKKLHAVRHLLKSSDISVIEACTSHGFFTPSRFARQYKRLFGELPSETKT